jgi:hypothetical protein
MHDAQDARKYYAPVSEQAEERASSISDWYAIQRARENDLGQVKVEPKTTAEASKASSLGGRCHLQSHTESLTSRTITLHALGVFFKQFGVESIKPSREDGMFTVTKNGEGRDMTAADLIVALAAAGNLGTVMNVCYTDERFQFYTVNK